MIEMRSLRAVEEGLQHSSEGAWCMRHVRDRDAESESSRRRAAAQLWKERGA